MGSKPKVDMSAQNALAARQRVASAELDSVENTRRKQLLSSATGVRGYRGSALFRAAASYNAGA